MASLEHINVTVRDPAITAALIADLFGWQIRWQGPARGGGHTIHIGTDDQYLALYTDPAAVYDAGDFAPGRPLNHIGIVVADLDAAERRARAAGLEPFNHGDYPPGRRFYLLDPDGIEYEVVSYARMPAAA